MNLGKRIAIGALGGVAGAFVMSLIMAAGKKMGFVHDPIPHRIERTIERRLGKAHKTSRNQEALIAQVGHHLMGAGYGSAYGALTEFIHLPGYISGPLYGLGVYVINEVAMGPAFSLTPPPNWEQERTVVRRILMHLAYGLALAAVTQGVERAAEQD